MDERNVLTENCDTTVAENSAVQNEVNTVVQQEAVAENTADAVPQQESVVESTSVTMPRQEAPQPKKGKKGLIIGLAAGVAALLVLIVGIVCVALIASANSVDAIDATEYEVTLYVDDEYQVEYTITPEDKSDVEVTWEVIPEGIISVDETGKVKALAEGKAQVVLSVGKKMDVVDIIVKDGPDFQKFFDEFCESEYATVASDGSYLTIDTNPDNIDDYTNYSAYFAIGDVNEALGLPESLMEKMNRTRAMDGVREEEYDEVRVTWQYHPDNGLSVTYEPIN